MEIVVEYVLLQNLFIDLFIFKTTEKILKIKGRFFFLISLFASIFAIIFPLFHVSGVWSIVLKAFFGILLCTLAFKFKKFSSFLKIYIVFMFVTFLYGGVATFFVQSVGQIHTLIMLGIIFVTYLIMQFAVKFVNKRKNVENCCTEVILKNGEKEFNCKGFLDTGNLLVDPLTQRPICIIGWKLFSHLETGVDLEDVLRKNVDKLPLAHYVMLDTVGRKSKVLAFEIDKLKAHGKEVEKPILALCFKNFPNYEIILHSSFGEGV